jgi:hypothetical protein
LCVAACLEVIMTATAVSPRSSKPSNVNRLHSPRRRSVPHLILGALLVTTCTAGGVAWSLVAGERQVALVLARPVMVGDRLSSADLREASVALDGVVDAIPATEAATVIGEPLSVSLPAGALLPRGAVGAPPSPPQGRAVAALALDPGQAPRDVAAGVAVLVVLTADPSAETAVSALGWEGMVTSVVNVPLDAGRVVSVELDTDDARQVAAAPTGRLSLIVVAGGER